MVNAPPFNFVLAGRSHKHSLAHVDLASYLLDEAGTRRSMPVLLPMIRINDGNNPVSYGDLIHAID